MKIAIDKGHNCAYDRGAVSIRKEDDLTREVGTYLIQYFQQLGHTVIDVTPSTATSTLNSLQQRVQKANANGVDLYISIHFNCGGGVGAETYVCATGGKAEQFANKVQSKIVALGYRNRGVKTGNFYVIKNTSAPAILVECAFVDSQEDMTRYNAPALAKAIIEGVTGQSVVAPAQAPAILGYGVVTASSLNVRDGASTSAPILGQLPKGTKVKIGFKKDNFYNIFYGSHGGFVSADYIKLV